MPSSGLLQAEDDDEEIDCLLPVYLTYDKPVRLYLLGYQIEDIRLKFICFAKHFGYIRIAGLCEQ